jgi:hypothetical protein
MSQLRSTGLAVVAAFVGVMACGPQVEAERPSNRDIAAKFCSHTIEMDEQCKGSEPVTFPEDVKQERQMLCESASRWDWTDECADGIRAHAECVLSVTSCEPWRIVDDLVTENDGPAEPAPGSPCAKEKLAMRQGDCKWVYDENGNEIDHGQEEAVTPWHTR